VDGSAKDRKGQTDEDSEDTLRAALEAGVTHFDTAKGYGRGRSEEICGRVLAPVREDVFIATKLFFIDSKSKTSEEIDQSLKRLSTEWIDLLYIHWPKTGADLRPMMEALEEARQQGKIRGIGVSNFSVDQMRQVEEVGKIDAHQLCYSLLWRWDEEDIIPYCQDNGIAVVAYSPLAQGILTGKFERKPRFQDGEGRSSMVLFDEEVWPSVHREVERLKAVAADEGRSLTHLSIRWVTERPGVTTVIVGCRNRRQLEDNVRAMDGEADPSALRSLTEISDELKQHIPDTGNIFRFYP
jgi:aryl-alcohol dehydrogenase-like predicted oxidoreductase